jgi:hypothetical protein
MFCNLHFVFIAPIMANNANISIINPEVVYESDPDIELRSEVLTISLDEIKIEYEFYNHAQKEKNINIEFSLPETDTEKTNQPAPWDEVARTYFLIEGLNMPKSSFINSSPRCHESLMNGFQNIAFVNFKTHVNDNLSGQTTWIKYDILHDKYDSETLKRILSANQIPLSARYLNDNAHDLLNRNKTLQRKIKKLDLLTDSLKVSWRNKTTYCQKIIFPACRKTRVTHTYRPQSGYAPCRVSDTSKEITCPGSYLQDESSLPPSLAKKLHDFFDQYKNSQTHNSSATVHELQYALTKDANWKNGKIKRFKLIVRANDAENVILKSIPYAPHCSDNTYVYEAENFQPDTDLKIYFLKFNAFEKS